MTDHVTNKNLSKNLKEAGFPQESEFYWSQRTKYSKCKLSSKKELNFDISCLSQRPYVYFSAYLATELLKWLPREIYNNEVGFGLTCEANYNESGWSIYYDCGGKILNNMIIAEDTFQAIIAEMLLYLKKEGLI